MTAFAASAFSRDAGVTTGGGARGGLGGEPNEGKCMLAREVTWCESERPQQVAHAAQQDSHRPASSSLWSAARLPLPTRRDRSTLPYNQLDVARRSARAHAPRNGGRDDDGSVRGCRGVCSCGARLFACQSLSVWLAQTCALVLRGCDGARGGAQGEHDCHEGGAPALTLTTTDRHSLKRSVSVLQDDARYD